MFFLNAIRQGAWLNRRRIRDYPRIVLFLFVLFGTAWAAGLHARFMPQEGAVVTDFINVYAAGQVVQEGHPAEAYDAKKHKIRQDAVETSVGGKVPADSARNFLPWLYPPTFLSVAWIVSFFPYWTALAVYSIFGLALYVAAIRKLLPPYREAIWAALAFPGLFINLFAGQNGSLTAALLATGLFLVESSPIAAGAAFGALSYKPHFFVLIPLVLLVGRYWKALAATIASASLYAGLSFIVFGGVAWRAFFENSYVAGNLLKDGTDRWLGILHSVFSAARVFGGSVFWALVLQGIVALSTIAVLVALWKDRRISLNVRGAALATATLLISPYSFVYDQVLLAIPIALLVREGLEKGFLSYEKTFLFALWLLPFFVQDSGIWFALPLTPPMLIGLMALIWQRKRC